MPSLFSSRRRGSSAQPPVDRSTTSAATAAAGQAFLGRSASHTSLGAAAAAAALRSQTSSPEPVGSIQTKRMQRRASVSSTGSASVIGSGTRGGVGRGGLQRTNSGGSMTDRTFRSPSPGRQSSADVMDADEDAPPVPRIPQTHRRSASVEPPQRVMSPTPANGKRGSSVDRGSMPVKQTPRLAKRLSNVNEEQTSPDDAPPSPLRNFSRPMSSNGSPPMAKNKYTHSQGSWFTQAGGAGASNTNGRPRTSDRSSGVSANGIEMPLGNPRSKKRISASPGTHLSQANRNSIATSEPSSDPDSIMVFDPNTRTFITKQRDQIDEPDSPVKTRNEQVYDPNTRSFISRAQADAEQESIPLSTRTTTQAPTNRKQKPSIAALDTTLQPPPKNPARYSPASESPSSPRAMGFLHKQPSVVREEWEAEERAEASQGKGKQSRAVSHSAITPAKSYASSKSTPHQRSSSLDVPRGDQSSRGRNTSLSPTRSARFSASPVMDVTRHDPPGRGVSPVKSALKHSPASSVRATSPLVGAGAPSESDTVSDAGSQDGRGAKPKKSVRVSFDQQAQEIAPANSPRPAPVVDPLSDEDDDDEVMKPRPALPSFGSVRAQRMSPEPAEKVTETPPDREGASSDTALGGILAGSLRGNGKKVERENGPQDPLPPEVTSREMADYASDVSSEADVPAPSTSGADAPEPITRDFAATTVPGTSETTKQDDVHVPAISLQPPTPGVEDESKKDLQVPTVDVDAASKNRLSRDLSMPGGWGHDEDEDVQPKPDQATQPSSQSHATPTGDSAATQFVSPLAPIASEPTPSNELSDISEDSDDSAAFSDAEEDLSHLDDGGFASLDAIVESPMVTSTPVPKKSNLRELDQTDESPSAGRSNNHAHSDSLEDNIHGDWGEATAYWSKLSRQQREQIEREHMSDDDEPRPAPTKAKKKQTGNVVSPLKPALKQTPPRPEQEPAQSSGMRKSMRAQPGPAPAAADSGVHMRRSLRSGGSAGGGMVASMRDAPPQSRQRPQSEHIPEQRGAMQKKDVRPKSSSGLPSSAGGTAMRQSMRPASSDSASRPMPLESAYPPLQNKRASQQSQTQSRADPPVVSQRLQKELSKADDSDSESSFRKQRRRNRAASVSTMDSRGGMSMRRSMRGGPPEPEAAASPRRPTSPDAPRESKWRMRSMSPTGSLFGRRKQQPPKASVDSGARTTLRTQAPTTRNSSAPPAKQRQSTVPAAPSATSRFKSRFAADSDDEDDARPAKTFRSRFADSDDEDDEPANLTPVRGIPKQNGREDGDSTDLEEEEDEDPRKKSRRREKQQVPMVPDPSDVEKAMAAARRNLGMQENKTGGNETAQGSALKTGSLRKPQPPVAESSPQPEASVPAQRPVQQKAKRSFMGSILRRNRGSQASVATMSSVARPMSPTAAPSSPQAPATPPNMNKLRRTSYQNQPATRTQRGDSDLSTATAPEMYSAGNHDSSNWPLTPPVPKIPEHLSNGKSTGTPASPNSPTLPSRFNDAKEEQTPEPKRRPSTSDGNGIRLAKTMRPGGGMQRTASEQISHRSRSGGHVSFLAGDEGSEPGERPEDVGRGAPVYSRRTGKKKKFGMLRRAFGLDD